MKTRVSLKYFVNDCSSNLRIISSNSRVTSSSLQVTSSNPRAMCPYPCVQKSFNQ